MIDAHSRAGDAPKAEDWFARALAACIVLDRIVYGAMVNAHAASGNVARAEHWFRALVDACHTPDVSTFNLMIKACIQDKQLQ
eukprot:11201635-Lingulodinium_polyedra.AAC.1